ncbi:MAG TPA: hypothetical protein VGR61_10265 [Candidatus Dormibacteraeota bacterium]|nr:hypothetical protein [Candidatus Dormibacteraeota bacterium]
MVAAGDRLRRAGRAAEARITYGEAAALQASIVNGLSSSRHFDTVACGCVLLYRLAGSPVEARACAERYLRMPVDEAAEGWLLDQVSELTLGSYVSDIDRGRSAMGELIKLRDRVG